MSAAEQEALQARRPTTHATQDDSVTVPMLQADHHDQFENPFQQRPQPHHPPQRHYNVMIPAVEHWPSLFMEGVQASTLFVADTLRQLHAYRQSKTGTASSSAKYDSLPTSTRSTTTTTSSRRSTFTFGSKRQLKESGGRAIFFSGRRLSQLLLLLGLAILIPIWVFMVPHTLKPYKNRDVWIRYLNHEEPIKIQVPLGRTIHVADMRIVAFTQLSQGYSYQQLELGKLILVSDRFGRLPPDTEWRNWECKFGSSPERPILLIDPRYELYQFLNSNLRCLSDEGYYMGHNEPALFKPINNDWAPLANVLHTIRTYEQYGIDKAFKARDILYLRQGFNDPKRKEKVLEGQFRLTQQDVRTNAWQKPVWREGQSYNDNVDTSMWDLPDNKTMPQPQQ
ncbi:hypothetical protein EMPS_02668 [Entomortierella parvispora]|uniref:Uncharacterized protein n=1 Tax=Entomortierella parvispora TaxID=205924 RepID=A0A9P3H560_9FUNG|nr:hypothetical protein EMPS_02668 [Entomortierella parvispora]